MLRAPGYWGPQTSTVDWCEANYRYSPYVCEFFNTVSSVFIVAAGLLGILLHRNVLSARFFAAFGAVVLVGLGSTAFHATLRFELQMLDELPMVYSALIMLFILLENRPTRRFHPQLHAVWHLLVSCGLYLLTLVIARDRLTTLGAPSHVVWLGGWLPRLTIA